MGTQGTVLVSSALYGNNDEQSHGALLNQNKYDVSYFLLNIFCFLCLFSVFSVYSVVEFKNAFS